MIVELVALLSQELFAFILTRSIKIVEQSSKNMFDSTEKYKSEFEHVSKIGSGKFGTVHQVRNVHSSDVFAAKVVK